jgi:hypothetical protein
MSKELAYFLKFFAQDPANLAIIPTGSPFVVAYEIPENHQMLLMHSCLLIFLLF